MSGGGGVQYQFPAPLYEAENQLFGSLPFPGLSWNNGGALGSPYEGVLLGTNSLSPNTASGATNSIGSNIAALGSGGASLLSNINNALGSGNNIASALAPYIGQAATAGDAAYSATTPYIGQALAQGFDPQNQLFNKLFQQQQDQSNAVNAMSGVATTPYGAALTTQGNQNFDLAWQQQQLANQAQGANTAATLANTGVGSLLSGLSGAGSLGNSVMSALSSGYGTAGGLLGAANGAFGTQVSTQQQQIQDYLNYILGNTQNTAAYAGGVNNTTNAAASATNSAANAETANNSGKSGLGGALSGIGGLVGKVATGGKGP